MAPSTAFQQSIVGVVMSKRVVVLVLALVLLTPTLTYFAPDTSNQYALDYLEYQVWLQPEVSNPLSGQGSKRTALCPRGC